MKGYRVVGLVREAERVQVAPQSEQIVPRIDRLEVKRSGEGTASIMRRCRAVEQAAVQHTRSAVADYMLYHRRCTGGILDP